MTHEDLQIHIRKPLPATGPNYSTPHILLVTKMLMDAQAKLSGLQELQKAGSVGMQDCKGNSVGLQGDWRLQEQRERNRDGSELQATATRRKVGRMKDRNMDTEYQSNMFSGNVFVFCGVRLGINGLKGRWHENSALERT